MTTHQAAITQDLTKHARYLQFTLVHEADPRLALQRLAATDLREAVIGLGQTLVTGLARTVAGLRELPASGDNGVAIVSTPVALWVWLRGDDRGDLVLRAMRVAELLAPAFELHDATDGFMHLEGRDLSGYVDGTENPAEDDALNAAIVKDQGVLDGSSFVAVQRWIHDLPRVHAFEESERDAIFGRRYADNEEIADAPASAHVKRAAQESFSPEAFVLRRSMPWSDTRGAGLVFVAFGKSFDAYEALLARMVGREDGIVDALFRFTRPVTGSYFWCPPVRDTADGVRLDLSAIGL